MVRLLLTAKRDDHPELALCGSGFVVFFASLFLGERREAGIVVRLRLTAKRNDHPELALAARVLWSSLCLCFLAGGRRR